MVIVAALVLRRQVRGLMRAVEDAGSRVTELTTELQEEAAVATLEIEAISQRVQDAGDRRKSATIRRA